MRKDTIDIITLGCSKNLVDAERLMAQLELAGYCCRHDSKRPNGEIAIINTCGFIGDAKEESIRTILQFADRKQRGKLRQLYVMGCLSQRYLNDLKKEIPEVDGWYGKFDFMQVIDQITHKSLTPTSKVNIDYGIERHLTTPRHYAYLKISEGCNRMCSYCAIPIITGRHHSRPMDSILDEARWLVKQGVKEINVIAQDLSSYGLDLETERDGKREKGKHLLPALVEQLAQIEGIQWIRLHYAYPTDFPEELLDVMNRHRNVCRYLDIALQHCTDHMLGLMRRHITREEQDTLIRYIREKVPDICIRTTIMVGHPGETEEDFSQLKEWIRQMRFERLGAFAYSDEDGTYANQHYQDDVPTKTKQKRLEEIMSIQQEIAADMMREKIGKTLRVVIDRKENNYFIGRTEQDSPEVDCEVLISTDKNLRIGHFYPILITKAEEFDLYGTI